MSLAKLIGAQLGVAIFGPPGALVGGVAGAVIDAALPWGGDVVKNVVAELLADRVQHVAAGLARRGEAAAVNHDLQRSFRDAVREALADIGGPTCLPKSWPDGRRDVPLEVVYLSSPLGQTSLRQRDELAGQVCDLLTALTLRIVQNDILPLQPPQDQPAASALTYLESATSQAVADALYEVTVLPLHRQYASLFSELPDLERHLRRYLLDRTLVHMGELLKKQTEPWRAFNRWILEDLRSSMALIRSDNQQIIAGLAALNGHIERLVNRAEADPGMERIAAATADSVGAARLAEEDMTLLVDKLIDGVAHHQARQLEQLRDFIAEQARVIIGTIGDAEGRIVETLAVNQAELLRRLERMESAWLAVQAAPLRAGQPRGQIIAAFRADALRLHRTQSISWRGAGGIPLPLNRVYLDQELLPWGKPTEVDGASAEESQQAAHGQSPGAALLDQRTLVVLGEPGSGKTLLLHALGLQLADTCALDAEGAILRGFLPVLVPLAGFTGATADLGAEPATRLLGYIQRVVEARVQGMTACLDDLIEQGRVAFLFDALDEIGDRTEQQAAIKGIQALAHGAGSRCLFVLTSREAPYGGTLTLDAPFRTYRLAPLATSAQQMAIHNWLMLLSGLDERDRYSIEERTRQVIRHLELHPGLQEALRNPLLLRITLQVYLWTGATEGIPGIGQRFDLYVHRLLAGDAESSTRNPGWPDLPQARQSLALLAWRIHAGTGRLTMAEASQLLSSKMGFPETEARRFVRRMQEDAGLLVLNAPKAEKADPQHIALALGPHALFGDFLVGSELARRWREDRRGTARLLRQRADDPTWHQAIFFCLSLLSADEAERRPAFRFVLDELSRRPLWGVRCLHAGLELTADELDAPDRRQVHQRLVAQADAVLTPGLLKSWRFRLQHRTDDALRTALRGQYDALCALGKLQLCEAAEPVLRAVFWLSVQYKHVGEPLRSALVDFGPRCLWPGIQAALETDEEWIRRSAAWIISGWRDAAAIPALEWLLEREEFASAAIYGLAKMTDPAVEATYRNLLVDPRYADDALSAGLRAQRPGLLEHTLDRLRKDQLKEHHVKFLLEYALRLSVADAEGTVRAMLSKNTTAWRITWVFEVDRTLQLPLLRILVSLLRDPDVRLRKGVQEAIPRALKAGDLDPHFQDSQGLLEQILLFADDWLPGEAARQLGSTPLSLNASQTLWERLENPETQGNVVWLLRALPPLPEEYRQRFIRRLKQEAETTPHHPGYLYHVLACLGERSVIPAIDRLLKQEPSPSRYDEDLLKALVRLQAVEAYPYVLACITERNDWDLLGPIALAMLAPKLSLQERREAARHLRPLLDGDEFLGHLAAICALGELRVSTPEELLAQVQENVPETQEPAIGLALARLGNYDALAPLLEATYARRDATLCFVVLHAWGALRDARGINPLLQTLGLPDDFLRAADHLLSGGDLVAALRYVKARAATALGRLAASLAGDFSADLDPQRGWHQLLMKLDDRSLAWAPGVGATWRQAMAHSSPAQTLYEQALTSRGRQQDAFAWLVGAYEWSELATHLLRRHEADSVLVWETIATMFDQAKEDEQGSARKQLAGRIGWTQEHLPFGYLMRLAAHRDEQLHAKARYYFAREAREWHAWLKWRAEWFTLPK